MTYAKYAAILIRLNWTITIYIIEYSAFCLLELPPWTNCWKSRCDIWPFWWPCCSKWNSNSIWRIICSELLLQRELFYCVHCLFSLFRYCCFLSLFMAFINNILIVVLVVFILVGVVVLLFILDDFLFRCRCWYFRFMFDIVIVIVVLHYFSLCCCILYLNLNYCYSEFDITCCLFSHIIYIILHKILLYCAYFTWSDSLGLLSPLICKKMAVKQTSYHLLLKCSISYKFLNFIYFFQVNKYAVSYFQRY